MKIKRRPKTLQQKGLERRSRYATGNVANFLTMDPGLGGLGWAVWDQRTFDDLTYPITSGVLKSDEASLGCETSLEWYERALRVAMLLRTICKSHLVAHVYYEQAEYRGSGSLSRGEDFVKLCTSTGIFVGAVGDPATRPCTAIPVSMWKGSLDKRKTLQRIRQALPKYTSKSGTDHEDDAVGIGLFVKGHFE